MAVTTRAGTSARRAADSKPMAALARFGLVARGVIYAIVGVIAVQIAFGGGGQADKGGAVAELAGHSYGSVALWLVAVGVAGLTLWRLGEAAFGAAGSGGKELAQRAKSLARAALYGFFCVSLVLFLLGDSNRATKSSNSQSQSLTARVMQHTGGRWLIALAGVVVIGVGGYLAYRGAAKKFLKHLNLATASARTRTAVTRLGQYGGIARGVIAAGIGIFLLVAAIRFDPDKAKGVDGTLRSLADAPFGPVLLTVVAVGLVAFGAYSCCEARWREV
jgi:Domain of Unknown Function (DUF1206)